MSALTKAWLGYSLVTAGAVIYVVKGLPSGWDMLWHGGLMLFGLGLMLPQFFPGTTSMVGAALRDVLGRGSRP